MTTTQTHFNETPLERELRFLERHIERLENLLIEQNRLIDALNDDIYPPTEDERSHIYARQTDIEIELVLLEACYDRKAKLEAQS